MSKISDYSVPLASLSSGSQFTYTPPGAGGRIYEVLSIIGPNKPDENKFTPIKYLESPLMYFEESDKFVFPTPDKHDVKPEMFEYLEVFQEDAPPLPGFVLVGTTPAEIKHLGVYRRRIWRRVRFRENHIGAPE